MDQVRRAAVAGAFYPADPDKLGEAVRDLLDRALPAEVGVKPAMLIVPHAGYVYSGPVAATAYRLLAELPERPQRIVLLGPSHFSTFTGIAAPAAAMFETPLGAVRIAAGLPPGVNADSVPHEQEHCLEVQLPFLQSILPDMRALPLLTGNVVGSAAADVLEAALEPPGSFGIISSDLSHYLEYEAARHKDRRTAAAITALATDQLAWNDACGRTAVQAALIVARRRGWQCVLLDLRNSGDTAGDKRRVVGYGAFAIGPPA